MSISYTPTFLQAMKSRIVNVYIKLEFYDNNMNYIGEYTGYITKNNIGHLQADSNYYYVEEDRQVKATGRAFTLELDNTSGNFTFDVNNLIWINKRVKLYIGLMNAWGNIEYVQQGVFVIATPWNYNTKDKRTVTINASDKGYFFDGGNNNRGIFAEQTTIESGTSAISAFEQIANLGGETKFNIDPAITALNVTLPSNYTYNVGSQIWSALQDMGDLCTPSGTISVTSGGAMVFYDTQGYLNLKLLDISNLQNQSPVWSFNSSDSNENFFIDCIRKLDDTDISNDIIAVGGSSTVGIVSYELKVNQGSAVLNANPNLTPYSTEQIGTLTYCHNGGSPDPAMLSISDCFYRCKFELMRRLGFTETLELNCKPIYFLDINDVVSVYDTNSGTNGNFLVQSITLPIVPDKMTLTLIRFNQMIQNWDFVPDPVTVSTNVSSISTTGFTIVFNQSISGLTSSNFTLDGGIIINSVTANSNNTSYTFTTSTMTAGSIYNLTISQANSSYDFNAIQIVVPS